VELLEASAGRVIARYTVVVGVETGEDGRPRGTTQREAEEGVIEGSSLFRQQRAQLRHLLSGVQVQVIGKDEDYVGSSIGLFLLAGFEVQRFSPRTASGEKGQQTNQDSERRSRHPKPVGTSSWHHAKDTCLLHKGNSDWTVTATIRDFEALSGDSRRRVGVLGKDCRIM
jgi:hypothetical protein